jgi:hypothetical protein
MLTDRCARARQVLLNHPFIRLPATQSRTSFRQVLVTCPNSISWGGEPRSERERLSREAITALSMDIRKKVSED